MVLDASTGNPAPEIGGRYQLIVGKMYLSRVLVKKDQDGYTVGVDFNSDDYHYKSSINLHNIVSDSDFKSPKDFINLTTDKYYMFTITPSKPVDCQLAFRLVYPDESVISKDAGVELHCYSDGPGIHGQVTSRTGESVRRARFTLKDTTSGLIVEKDSQTPTILPNGFYRFENVEPGRKYELLIENDDYSPFHAVNITCPETGGIRIDCCLEEAFPVVIENGIKEYKTYDDRSHGSTRIHVVTVDRTRTTCEVVKAGPVLGPQPRLFQTGEDILRKNKKALVAINGGNFESVPPWAKGYLYPSGIIFIDYVDLSYSEGEPTAPVLGIVGTGTNQVFKITEKSRDTSDSTDWHSLWPHAVRLWDDIPYRDGISDVDYAVQSPPSLVPEPLNGWSPDHHKFWPRTAVGINSSGNLILVVADGEGLGGDSSGNYLSPIGCQGASLPQLAEFFSSTLKASVAMNLDGGGSSQLVMRLPQQRERTVNTPTAETGVPPNQQVHNYIVISESHK